MMELNKVYQGDCLEVMKDIPDKSVDMILTSPPYDNLRTYNGSLDWGEHIWKPAIKELYRIIKDGGVVVWIVGDATIKGSETGTSFRQALFFKEIGFNLHDTMIWRKPNPMPYIKKDTYTPSFEYMFVLSKGKPKSHSLLREPCKYAGKLLKTNTTNPESIRKPNKTVPTKDTKIRHNVWDFIVAGTNHGHPAIFPEKLAEDHILSWSNEGDIILDPFAGSGTTGIAARNLKRNFILIEKDEEYCKIAEERLKENLT